MKPWLQELGNLVSNGVPLLLQQEAAECGLVCLAMVAGYHGSLQDMTYLRREYRTSMRGARVDQLLAIAPRFSLVGRALRADAEQLKAMQTPCMLHWDEQHYVVLVKCSSRGAVIHDPAIGVKKLSWQRMADHFSGTVIELSPVSDPIEKNPITGTSTVSKLGFAQLVGNVHGLRKALGILFLIGLAVETITLLLPLFIQWVTDHALASADVDLLIALCVAYGFLMILKAVLEALRGWSLTMMRSWFNVQWTANTLNHLLSLPILYYQRQLFGDILSRFNVILTIQNTVSVSFVAAILDGVMSIGLVIVMLLYSPSLTGWVLATVAVYALLRIALIQIQRKLGMSYILGSAKQESGFIETLRSMPTLRANSHEAKRLSRWMNQVVSTQNIQIQQEKWMVFFQAAKTALNGIGGLLIFSLGAYAVIKTQFSIGMLLAFVAYSQQLAARSMSLIDRISELRLLDIQALRLQQILGQTPEEPTERAKLPPPSFTPEQFSQILLQARGLNFRYNMSDPLVLAGIDIDLKRQQLICIEGAAGSGKSTLIQGLLGFYPTMAGNIWLGGVALQNMGLKNYRAFLGSVLSQDVLLAGTIAENICLFSTEPDMQRIQACATVVGLAAEVERMPMRYFSVVGDMGSALSTALRQKVFLARAIYTSGRAFLILDDPLNQIPEAERNEILDRVLGNGFGILMTTGSGRSPKLSGPTQAYRYLLKDGKLLHNPEVANT